MLCRTSLFDQYYETAKIIARLQYKRRPSYGLDISDFEQLAFSGLLEAIDRYDPLKNIPFKAYAHYRIVGSITDGLSISSEEGRQYSHRQRLERERLRSLNSAKSAKSEAIAQLSDVAVFLALGLIIETTGNPGQKEFVDTQPNAYETLSWREMQMQLNHEVGLLPNNEKTVVEQHYVRGLAFVQIAKLLQLTKGRISQLHNSALLRLRRKLGSFFK